MNEIGSRIINGNVYLFISNRQQIVSKYQQTVCANMGESDKTAWMCRLICSSVFAHRLEGIFF